MRSGSFRAFRNRFTEYLSRRIAFLNIRRTTLKKHITAVILAIALIFPCFSAFSDDAGIEVPPSTIAADEAAQSALNYGQTLCKNPDYYCRRVTDQDHWYSLFPNFQQREEVMRLNRTNVSLRYRDWLAVPKDFSKTSYMDMSPLPTQINTHGKKMVVVNLKLFAFGAYDPSGKLIYWGPVSSGRAKCFDNDKRCTTVKGKFRMYRIGGENCVSNEFPLETHGGAPMPYCMFVHGGTAMHASTLSGFINRSSGCIRLFDDDALWLNKHFVHKGLTVVVKG